MEALAPYVFAFSDDGKGVQSEKIMKKAIAEAVRLGKPISAHCEVEALLSGGSVHEGEWAERNNKKGISSASEWKMIERDINLLRGTDLRYDVCHISTKESVDLIRRAKAEGLSVTAETAPHYLTMTDNDIKDEGRFKMNPPIRSEADRKALVEGFIDGTIDYLATDHAPHSREEKCGKLEESLFGIVGLETAFSVVYTELVKTGKMSLEALIERMAVSPKKFLGLDYEIKEGKRADLVVLNLEEKWKIKGEEFASAGKFTPFEGKTVYGAVEYTIHNGRIVWQRNSTKN
jgi:dihydroorotase